MAHQSPAHGDHLLFTAGQRAGKLASTLLQTRKQIEHHVKVGGHRRIVLDAERAHLQILLDAHAREHMTTFRNMRHAVRHDIVVALLEQIMAVEHHRTGFRRHQTGDGMQRSGFAGAVRTDQRNDLAVVHMHADVLDGIDRAIGHTEILDVEHQFPSSDSVSSSAPRYAETTCGLLATSSGRPEAMVRP